MDSLGLSYTTAIQTLDEIQANASIRETADKFLRPRASVVLSSPTLEARDKDEFQTLLDHLTSPPDAQYRALTIAAVTVIEYFFKSCIRSYVAYQTKSGSALSRHLLATNLANSGRFFRENKDRYMDSLDGDLFDSLINGLQPCTRHGGSRNMDPKIFVRFFSNCSVKQISEIMNDVGLNTIFNDELGKQADLKANFGGGKARDVLKQVKATLDNLIDRRNRYVHDDGVAEAVGYQTVIDDIRFIRSFCTAMMAHFRLYVPSPLPA